MGGGVLDVVHGRSHMTLVPLQSGWGVDNFERGLDTRIMGEVAVDSVLKKTGNQSSSPIPGILRVDNWYVMS